MILNHYCKNYSQIITFVQFLAFLEVLFDVLARIKLIGVTKRAYTVLVTLQMQLTQTQAIVNISFLAS